MRQIDPMADSPSEFLTIRAIDEETKVFHGYGNHDEDPWLGCLWIAPPMTGMSQETIDKMVAAMKSGLPAGTVVQFGLLSAPDIAPIVNAYRSGKAKSGILSVMVDHQAELIMSGVDNPIVPLDGVLLSRKRLIVTLKVPATIEPSPVDINLANDYCDSFEHAMAISGIHLERADRSAALRVYRLILGMYTPMLESTLDTVDESLPLREQVGAAGNTIDYEQREISFNDGAWYAKVLSTHLFPKYANLGGMNAFVGDPDGIYNQITDPYWLCMTIRIPDQVAKGDWMRTRASVINHQAFGPMMRLIPKLKYKKEGMDILTDEIDGKSGAIVEVNLTMVIYSRDRDNLLRLTGALRAYFAALKFDIREDARVLREVFNEFLPLNTTETGTFNLRRMHTMGLVHACYFLPVIGDAPPQSKGVMLMTTRRGDPGLFDLYASPSNRNAVLAATAGAGKSQWLQGLAKDYLAEGARVWMVEAGRSFFKMTKVLGGQYIEFNDESDICCNPFTSIVDINDEMDHLVALHAKMAAPNEVLSDARRALFAQAIQSVFGHKGNTATPEDVADFLLKQENNTDANALGQQMYPFAKGHYAKWLNGVCNVDFNADLVAVELQDLAGRPDLQQVILLQILSKIADAMLSSKNRRPQILMIDEAWAMLDDPLAAKAIEALYRKVRKNNGSVLIATQGIGDLYRSKHTQAILDNSAWQILLRQSPESIDTAIASGQFKIDDYGRRLMMTLNTQPGQYSEVMVRLLGGGYNVFRYVAPRFDQVVFSTTGEARYEVMARIDAGEDPVKVIDDFIEKHPE